MKAVEAQFGRPPPGLPPSDSTDAFANGVTDIISKGVLCYTNLPARECGGGSPRNKHKGGGGAPAGT